MIDVLLVAVGLLGLSIASITDLRTREIPDWLSFSLIATGISFRLMQAVSTGSWNNFEYTIIAVILMFLLGTLMYYTKQWGGGDTKLLVAIAAIFAVTPYQAYFLINSLINLVIVSTFYGIAWCIYFAIKNQNKFIEELPIYFKKNKHKIKLLAAISIILLLPLLVINQSQLSILIISASALLFSYPFLVTFIEAVERSAMFKEIKVSKLTEGDWITKDLRINNKLIYSKSSPGIEKHQINLLKKSGIKYVPIKDGIPFVPSFLIAIITTLIFGNFIILFI